MKRHYATCLLLMTFAGCYNPDLEREGFFRCSDGLCPDGFVCSASRCVKPSDATVCEPSGYTAIADGLTTAIGLAVDPVTQRLYVAFAGASEVFVASRDIPEGNWTVQRVARRGVASGQVGFTAVDAFDDRIAVVFDGNRELAPKGLEFVPRTVQISTDLSQAASVLDVTYGTGSGAYVAVRHIADRSAMLVSYRSDDRTQLVAVDRESHDPLHEPLALPIPESGPQMAGQYNRVVVASASQLEIEAYVGFLATSEAAGVQSTQAYLSRVLFDAAAKPAQEAPVSTTALGELSTNVPEAALGLDLAVAEGLHAVWTIKPGNQTQVMYQAPDGRTSVVQPGGELPASAGAPSLAVHDGRAGLTYADDDGVLWLTVRPSLESDAPWLASLPIEDTRAAGALQAKVAILQSTGNEVVMGLAYVNNARQLRYRTVVCTLP